MNDDYTLSNQQIEFFDKHRFIKLMNVLDSDTIAAYNRIISERVTELNSVDVPIEKRDTYGKAF